MIVNSQKKYQLDICDKMTYLLNPKSQIPNFKHEIVVTEK